MHCKNTKFYFHIISNTKLVSRMKFCDSKFKRCYHFISQKEVNETRKEWRKTFVCIHIIAYFKDLLSFVNRR